jgi:hypothetical protein
MKMMVKASSILVFLIMAVSCATTTHILPEKYNLNNELKEVDQISAFRDIDVELVDNQSIILEVNRNEYYLLVLRDRMEIYSSQLAISIDNTASKDRAYSAQRLLSQSRDSEQSSFRQAPSHIASIVAGYDKVVVHGSVDRLYYVIEKIYKLTGRDQKEKVKERLRQS